MDNNQPYPRPWDISELDKATRAANQAADDWYRQHPNDDKGANRAADAAYNRAIEELEENEEV